MRNVAGLDVHKDSVYLCILQENGEKIEKIYGVLTPELDSMRDLLVENDVGEVAMESTSIYWIPIWRVLESDFRLKLVNPLFIKQLPGRKSDVKDAEWIATCLKKDLIRGSYVPDETIQRMRQYDRRIFDLNNEINRKLSKMDAVMQRCNIRLSNYVSNTDCKSYRDVVNLLCQGITDPKALLKVVHRRIVNHHTEQVILASLTGVVSEAETDCLRQLKEEIDLAQKHKQECQDKLTAYCEKLFPEEYKNLQTIPGVKERAATSIIAEVGVDMGHFSDGNHLGAWAGLKPRNDESNKKVKSRRITHGNKYLRKTLIECSWAAARTKDCFFSKFSYRQVQVRKKGKLKVQVAIARKILVCVWNILSKNEPYRDYDPDAQPDTSSNND